MNLQAALPVLPIVISSLALLLSGGSLFYTIRLFTVTQRPYVGVTEVQHQFVENPPRAMLWKAVVKNVGALPGNVRVDENTATITTHAGVTTLSSLGGIGRTMTFLMPGQTIDLIGQYSEVGSPTKMSELLNGSATLDLKVRLSYDNPGWFFGRTRHYSTSIRFHVTPGVMPGFAMVSAESD